VVVGGKGLRGWFALGAVVARSWTLPKEYMEISKKENRKKKKK